MKSLITNTLSLLLIVAGYFSPIAQKELTNMGLFAFSGAITNWLAIYMLFEKIPFLYGSGVIPMQFEQFKKGIKNLIMNQFFTITHVEKFISLQREKMESSLDIGPILECINMEELFQKLVQVILQSSFGSMLNMMGGAKALDGLKAPFIENLKIFMNDLKDKPEIKEKLHLAFSQQADSSEFIKKIEFMVDNRLEELTPNKVKEIIQDMIRQHLGWLVVWGGVFGALIGLVSSFV